ncbi:sensor histidine kinase [Streptomyces sp. NPDC003002]
MRTERGRLTVLYGSLLLLAGGGLVALVYVLVGQGLYASVSGVVTTVSPAFRMGEEAEPGRGPEPARTLPPGEGPTAEQLKQYAYTRDLSDAVTEATQHRLLTFSLIALAVFAVLSIWLAWWMAGRVLRPVGVITETARRLSGENLDERIALDAPPGELKQLADTFDAMLGRMEDLVCAQRRFAANAAHELRTPLAVQRAAAEIGLAGDPSPERVARIRHKLIDVADTSEHLIESLLLLAVSQEGLRSAEPVDLAELAGLAATDTTAEAAAAGTAETVPETAAETAPGTAAGTAETAPETAAAETVAEPKPKPKPKPETAPETRPETPPEAGVADTAAPAAGPHRGLTVVRTLAPLTVTGDRALLGHLVRNLLSNAVRHNRAGGRLTVATSADGGLTVSNTGPVIDPAEVPGLLEPFRRSVERQHTAGEGAGLGLSIVASVARAHGAELAAQANPAPEGGLTVRVRFPVPPAGPRAADAQRL